MAEQVLVQPEESAGVLLCAYRQDPAFVARTLATVTAAAPSLPTALRLHLCGLLENSAPANTLVRTLTRYPPRDTVYVLSVPGLDLVCGLDFLRGGGSSLPEHVLDEGIGRRIVLPPDAQRHRRHQDRAVLQWRLGAGGYVGEYGDQAHIP